MTQINNGDRVVFISTSGIHYDGIFHREQYGEVSQIFEGFEECDVCLIPQHDTVRATFKQIRHCTDDEDIEVTRIIRSNELDVSLSFQEEIYDNVYVFYHDESAMTLIGSMVEVNGNMRKFKVHGGGLVNVEATYLVDNLKRNPNCRVNASNYYEGTEAKLYSTCTVVNPDPNPHECEHEESISNESFVDLHAGIYTTPEKNQDNNRANYSPKESPIMHHSVYSPSTSSLQTDTLSYIASAPESTNTSEYLSSGNLSNNTSSFSQGDYKSTSITSKKSKAKKLNKKNGKKQSKTIAAEENKDLRVTSESSSQNLVKDLVNYWLDEAQAIHNHPLGLYICSPYKSRNYRGNSQLRVRYHNCPPIQDEWVDVSTLQEYDGRISTINVFDFDTVLKYRNRRGGKRSKQVQSNATTTQATKTKLPESNIPSKKAENQKYIPESGTYKENTSQNSEASSGSSQENILQESTMNRAKSIPKQDVELSKTPPQKRKRTNEYVAEGYVSPAIVMRKLAQKAFCEGSRKRRRISPLRM